MLPGPFPLYTPSAFGVTGSPAAGWTFTKAAQAGVAEGPIASFGVSDAVGSIQFGNASNTDTRFSGRITGLATTSSSLSGLGIHGQIDASVDTGAAPVIEVRAARSNGNAVTTRPYLDLQSGSNTVLSIIPLNSGANAALSWGTQAGAPPTFTTRSAGTRTVHYASISGSAVDIADGVSSATIKWSSIPQAASTSAFDWYGGTTQVMRLRGNGQLETTGAKVDKVRIALTTPVTVAAGTDYIVISNLSVAGAVAVNLPATPTTGLTYVVKDGKGDAGANNITITPAAGTIDGAATLVLNTNYARATLVYNGTEWNRID